MSFWPPSAASGTPWVIAETREVGDLGSKEMFLVVGSRGGLAIGSTGTFPGGPVTNGPKDGHFSFYFFYLFNFFFFFAMPRLVLVTIGNSPGPGRETCIGSAHSAPWLVCIKNTWPNGPTTHQRTKNKNGEGK